jgi:hypothetical protein
MKKLVLLSVVVLGLTGCNEIEGGMDVHSPLSLTTEKGASEQLKPASYEAKIKLNSDKHNIELKIKDGSQERKVKIAVPYAKNIPERNGTLYVKASESGQSFDIDGIVETVTDTSRTYEDYESCTYTERYRECDSGRHHGKSQCYDRTRTYTGSRYVVYYFTTDTTSVQVNFLATDGATKLATFTARNNDSKKHYDHYGLCGRRSY